MDGADDAAEPHYPKVRERGRPPVGLERMLRIYFLQQWFNLSDPAVEDALYDSVSMRRFVGIDLGREGGPDETTVFKFRHLLEARAGRGDADDGQGVWRRRGCCSPGHDRGRDHHRCAELDQEHRTSSAIRRCTRRRRASSGTSG